MADDKSGVSTIPTPPPPQFTQDERHHKESLGLRAQHLLHSNPTLGPVVVLVLSVIAFSLLNDRFLQPANLSLVLQQVTVLAVLALGQTIIILTAGIDLSVGAMAVFCSIVMAKLTAESGWPAIAALLLGAAIGAGLGALERRLGHAAAAATVHRHARDAEHLLRPDAVRVEERNHPWRRHAGPHAVDGSGI